MHFFKSRLSLVTIAKFSVLRLQTQGQVKLNQTALRGKHVAQLLLTLLLGLLLSACVTAIPAADSSSQPAVVPGQHISDIDTFALSTPAPVIVPDVTAEVITEDARANVRSGPALDAPIVAKANPGDTFQVTGRSDDGEWWQICCVAGPVDEGDEATERAWVSSVVIETTGNADAVPVIHVTIL